MAGLRRDVELIFRGEDRASPTIKAVRRNVGELTETIQQQLAAAERGEGSIDDLAKAYRKLNEARGDIQEITKLATAYENMSSKLDKQSEKIEEARAKQAALKAEMERSERPTKRLQQQYDTQTRKLDGLVAKQDQYAAELREIGAALDAAGGDSRDFAKTQELIRQAAIETARAVRDAAAAMDEFKGKQAQGRANIAAVDEAAAFNQLAAGSGLPQAQIQFISGLENRLEALQLAIREDQASMAALNAELRDRAAADAAGRIASMTRSLNEADAAAERLKVTTGFRQMAAEIEAGAREVSRFGPQMDTAATSARRLADAVDGILNPTQKAAATLDGINEIVAQSEAVVGGAKRRLSEYNAEVNNLSAATASISNIARLIDSFRQQEAVVARARREFDAAQADVLKLATAMQTAEQPTEQMAADLQKAETALERAGVAMQRETTRLAQLERGLESAKIDVTQLAAAEEQLVGAANRAAAAQAKLSATTSGKGNFLGLNPMELQQIGFQVNDIVVGITSGQRPLTVLIQQGLQIGQVIPGAFASMVRYIPHLAILAVTVGSVALAMKHSSDEARRLETAQGIVQQMGADAPATAAQFADLAKKLEDVGVEAEKARELLVGLAADGLDDNQMRQYIETATAMADLTGVEVPEAMDTLRRAFQGGLEDIIELDDQTNAYTESEIELIAQLFEQGRADEARARALGIYQAKMEDVAQQSAGPWKAAVDGLSSAWNNFLGWLSNTQPIENARNALHNLAVGIAYVSQRLGGKSHEEAARAATGTQLPSAVRTNTPDPNRRTNAGRQLAEEQERRLRAVTATTAAERKALAVEEARNDAISKGLSNLEIKEAQQRAGAIFDAEEAKRQEKRDAAAGKRAAAAARRAEAQRRREARAAEAEANRIANMEEALQRQLEQLDAKVSRQQTASLEQRLGAIDSEYEKLFRSIDEYSARTGGRGRIGDKTIAQAREHVRLQQEQLKNYATLDFYEERLNDLAKDRKEKLDQIADQVERGLKSPAEGLAESKTVIDDYAKKMTEMAQAALVFAQAIRGATPDPALEALIAKFQNVIQTNSGGQNVRAYNDIFKDTVEGQQARLNNLIQQRSQLVELENMKVQLGLQTQRQAQENIMRLYQQSQPLILRHIQAIRALAASYGGILTPEMQAYFDALEANLKGVELESQGVDARFTELKSSIDQLLTSNIVGFIDSVTQAFARWVGQEGDVLDFLSAVGVAFLDMIAKTLQGIAMLIIQMLVLDAIEKITGIPVKALLKLYGSVHHEGGVVGDSSRGSRKRAVSPLAFANAPRYHSGGIAGLAPNETTAILKKGEEVLTEVDPRHRANGGLAPQGSGERGLRQILAIGDDEIAGAMAGAAGENVVLTHLRRNRATVKQIIS